MVPKQQHSAAANSGASAPPHRFTERGLRFLRGLARNNDREWFEQRRTIFEQEVKAPMLTLVARLTQAMAEFAPAHVRPAEKSLMRIYRDVRFSSDKRPYKTHIAAWWTRAGLPKTSGAGYFLSISGKEIQIAAGVYMPPKEQLFALRTFLLEKHEAYRRFIEDKRVRALFTAEEGNPLTRVPKGFPADHPAANLLRQRHWAVSATLPAAAALTSSFNEDVERYFRTAAPLVALLNEPLARTAAAKRKPLFGLPTPV